MGVLAPLLHTLDGSAHSPIDMSGNFPAHVSAESPSNISYLKFQNPWTTFENTPLVRLKVL